MAWQLLSPRARLGVTIALREEEEWKFSEVSRETKYLMQISEQILPFFDDNDLPPDWFSHRLITTSAYSMQLFRNQDAKAFAKTVFHGDSDEWSFYREPAEAFLEAIVEEFQASTDPSISMHPLWIEAGFRYLRRFQEERTLPGWNRDGFENLLAENLDKEMSKFARDWDHLVKEAYSVTNDKIKRRLVAELYSPCDPALRNPYYYKKLQPTLLRMYLDDGRRLPPSLQTYSSNLQTAKSHRPTPMQMLVEVLSEVFSWLPRAEVDKCELITREWMELTRQWRTTLALHNLLEANDHYATMSVTRPMPQEKRDGSESKHETIELPSIRQPGPVWGFAQSCKPLPTYLQNAFVKKMSFARIRQASSTVLEQLGVSDLNTHVRKIELIDDTSDMELDDQWMTCAETKQCIRKARVHLNVRHYRFVTCTRYSGAPPLDPDILRDPVLREADSVTLVVSEYVTEMPDYQGSLQRSCVEFAFSSPDCKKLKVISQWTAWSAVDVDTVVNRFETADDLEGMVASIKLSVHSSEENFVHPTCCYIPEKRGVVAEEKHPQETFDVYYFYNAKVKEFLTVAVNKKKILMTRGKIMY